MYGCSLLNGREFAEFPGPKFPTVARQAANNPLAQEHRGIVRALLGALGVPGHKALAGARRSTKELVIMALPDSITFTPLYSTDGLYSRSK